MGKEPPAYRSNIFEMRDGEHDESYWEEFDCETADEPALCDEQTTEEEDSDNEENLSPKTRY